jgi:hypothetical protein
VDNPAVPNMVDTLSIGGDILGHGPVFQGISSVAILARPYNLATATRKRDLDDNDYALVPAAAIGDVVTLWPNYFGVDPRCPQLINTRFEPGIQRCAAEGKRNRRV